MTQKTLMIPLSALVWTLTLVALATALLITLGDASAQQPPISASIVDDNDQNTNSLCSGHVWSDRHCDLRIRVTDNDATDSAVTIVASPIFSGAFDASVITPDDSALSSQTLGPTPSMYTIPGNTRQIFRLRMTPVVTARGAQYYEGYVRVHHGAGTNGRQLAEYKLTLQAPTPTSVSSESITSTSFAVRWKMDERARRTIIFWRPRDDANSPEQSVKVTMVQNAKYRLITGLQSSTCYVARVQPLLDGKSLESAEIEVATVADPDATDPPVDPCAPPTPPPCTTSGDYDVDDDGLIEVSCLQQLDAIRHDLDGNGVPDINPHPPNVSADFTWDGKTQVESTERHGQGTLKTYTYARGDFSDAERQSQYLVAYPSPDAGMGCPTSGCKGYELSADLDFDANDDDDVDANDPFWNNGAGWRPIMGRNYSSRDYWSHRYFRGVSEIRSSNSAFNAAKMFRAVFEGNGHTISNLYINRLNEFHVGLFGHVALGAEIRNIGLISPTVRGLRWVGSLVGEIEGATVRASYVQHANVSGRMSVGGLIGNVWGGKVVESYATGRTSGSSDSALQVEQVGGLIGLVNMRTCAYSGGRCHSVDTVVKYSFADVSVSSSGNTGGGGLFGHLASITHLQHTYASGSVTAVGQHDDFHIAWGALIGFAQLCSNITQSYATASVSGHDGGVAGGLIGRCTNEPYGRSWNSYWDTHTTGQPTSSGNRVTIDGTTRTFLNTTQGGKTTSELQTPTGPTGIYQTWGPITVNGEQVQIWDFGTSSQYPILVYCSAKPGIDLPEGKTEYCPLREATQHGRTYK